MAEQAHLVFRVADYTFALDIRHVLKIHDWGAAPEVPAWGEEVNLARFFGVESEARRSFRVDLKVEDWAGCFGADAVEDIQGLGLVLALEFPPILRTQDNRAIQGFFFDGLRIIHHLDAAALLASPRLRASLVRHGERDG